MDSQSILLAFSLTLFAGLATGIGSALAFFARRTNTKFLAGSLGFSAGVMIYISFVELFAEAQHALAAAYGESRGSWFTVIAFFTGILLIALLDRAVPALGNPHEIHHIEEMQVVKPAGDRKLYRLGVLAAITIAIHNFPEGLATFAAALKDLSVGIPIAIAIAIHNIPEGIAVSIPIFYSTGSKKKAFYLSFLSGLSEPVGALVGYLILLPFLNDLVLGVVYAVVAGIMVFISLDELLPTAQEYGQHHIAIYGLVAGMGVMAVSLLLL
jgi:ZIP family zinc transporter